MSDTNVQPEAVGAGHVAGEGPQALPPAARSRTVPEHMAQALLGVVRLGPILILGGIIVLMAILSEFFLTERNIQNLLNQTSVIALLAIGQLVVIVTRGIDISVGSVIALGTVTGALVYQDGQRSAVLVLLAIVGSGVLAGLFNGVVFVFGRIPAALIVTLGTYSIARGLAFVLSGGESLPGMPSIVLKIGGGFVGAVPIASILVAAFALVTFLFLTHARWGRWVYLIGGNQEAAKRAGIPVSAVLVSAYVFCGLAAGLAAVVTAGRTGAGAPTAGALTELDSIAAVVIGGVSILGGRGSVGNALVGALIIGVMRNGLNLLDIDPLWQLVAIGAIVIIAVELDVVRNALERRLRVIRALGPGHVGAAASQVGR